MTAPSFGDHRHSAPGPVKRQKRNLWRRHWISGALVFAVLGLAGYTGVRFYEVESRLSEVRASRTELQTRVREEQRRSQTLGSQLTRVASDQYMERLAKEMGFVYPGETVYQQGSGKGQ